MPHNRPSTVRARLSLVIGCSAILLCSPATSLPCQPCHNARSIVWLPLSLAVGEHTDGERERVPRSTAPAVNNACDFVGGCIPRRLFEPRRVGNRTPTTVLRGGGFEDLKQAWHPYPSGNSTRKGRNALHRQLCAAAKLGQTAEMLRYIRDGAEVNARDVGGFTALHMAAEKGQTETVQKLLEHVRHLQPPVIFRGSSFALSLIRFSPPSRPAGGART